MNQPFAFPMIARIPRESACLDADRIRSNLVMLRQLLNNLPPAVADWEMRLQRLGNVSSERQLGPFLDAADLVFRLQDSFNNMVLDLLQDSIRQIGQVPVFLGVPPAPTGMFACRDASRIMTLLQMMLGGLSTLLTDWAVMQRRYTMDANRIRQQVIAMPPPPPENQPPGTVSGPGLRATSQAEQAVMGAIMVLRSEYPGFLSPVQEALNQIDSRFLRLAPGL